MIPKHEKPPIPWWTGLVVFFLLSVLLFVSSMTLTTVLLAMDDSGETIAGLATPVGLVIQVLVVSTLFAGVALVVPRLSEVPVKPWLKLVPATPMMFGFALLGVVGIGFLVDEITFILYQTAPQMFDTEGLDMFNRMFNQAPPVLFVLMTLAVTLGPGLGEELLFRGLLLRSFLNGLPAPLAILFSSILFGVIHLDALQSVGAGIIGLYLGVVAYRCRSIWPAVAAHAINNFICAVFAKLDGDLSTVWREGHPVWVVIIAGLSFIGGLVGLIHYTRPKLRVPDLG